MTSPEDFQMNRRGLLRSGAFAVAAGSLPLEGLRRHATANEPIERNGRPKLKLSCAAYSFRSLLSGKNKKWTLDDFIDFCARQDLDGTELTGYYFPSRITGQYLMHLKRKAFLLGLDISGTAHRNDFCLPPGPKRDAEIAHINRWIEYAAAFGAPCIRIFSGAIPKGHSEAEARQWCVEGIEECCKLAAKKGVFLALENHGGLSSTASGLLAIVKQVESPWFGVNLDTGNFHSSNLYEELEQVAPHAVNVQVKVEVRPNGQDRQPADLERMIDIVRQANYRGYVALEYEAAEDPTVAVPRYLDKLRKIIG